MEFHKPAVSKETIHRRRGVLAVRPASVGAFAPLCRGAAWGALPPSHGLLATKLRTTSS
uniref:Uncharacterized protein n=1 Tax=Anguilla anguilla TaxID=7936 RepID=A0A0E9PLW2_ANGAN